MKRKLILITLTVLALGLATGCERGNRRLQDNSPTDQPQAAATTVPTQVPAQPTLASTDTPVATVTEVEPSATPIPTVTSAPATSQSDDLSSQLDDALNQLDQQLGGMDNLDDTPPAP